MMIYNRFNNHIIVANHLAGNSLAGKDLTDAGLSYFDMRGASFEGANLTNADLCRANLEGCSFKDAILTGAYFNRFVGNPDFTGAIRDMSHACSHEIRGWKVENNVMRRKRPEECNAHGCNHDDADDLRECGNCDEHCDHAFCESCSTCIATTDRRVCPHCDDCTACCNCETCGCGALTNCSFGSCSGCRSCCCCDDSEYDDVDEREYKEGAPFVFTPNSKFKCNRLVGVEWEFNEMIDLTAWREKWRGGIHSDGSCGWEAVTPPIAGDNIAGCLGDLGARMEADASCDKRCGIHVHVDAADLKWADMYRLLWVYAKVEPLLYLLAGQERAKGDYCKPVGKDYLKSLSEVDRKGAVLDIAIGGERGSRDIKQFMRSRQLSKKGGGRYRGLNIIPWIVGRAYPRRIETVNKQTGKKEITFKPNSDTTVEFRMHKNSTNAARVTGWAQLCARLVEWCSKATDKEAQDLPKSALRALCQVIAPDLAPYILGRVKEWRKATPSAIVYGGNSRKRNKPRRIKLTETGYELSMARY